MDKKVLLSELLLKALEYLKNPMDKEKSKEFEEYKNLIQVKTFLSLIDKEAALLNISYNQEQAFGDSSMGYTCVTELSLIVHGLLPYTNIDINMGIDYNQYGVYDTIMQSGLYDYILSYCETDFQRLEAMLRQMISFDNLFSLVETLGTLDTKSIENLTQTITDFKSKMDSGKLGEIIEAANSTIPIAKAFQEVLSPELIKEMKLSSLLEKKNNTKT